MYVLSKVFYFLTDCTGSILFGSLHTKDKICCWRKLWFYLEIQGQDTSKTAKIPRIIQKGTDQAICIRVHFFFGMLKLSHSSFWQCETRRKILIHVEFPYCATLLHTFTELMRDLLVLFRKFKHPQYLATEQKIIVIK